MEYYDALPNISLMYIINNSDLDGVSFASLCQSRAVCTKGNHCKRDLGFSPEAADDEVEGFLLEWEELLIDHHLDGLHTLRGWCLLLKIGIN